MNRSLLFLCCLAIVLCAETVEGQDIVNGLEPIGPVVSFTKADSTVTFKCQDGSEVRVYLLAPDLIRVRTSFKKPLPARDHSWAIAKQAWDGARWNLTLAFAHRIPRREDKASH
jgi:hypothetical protein